MDIPFNLERQIAFEPTSGCWIWLGSRIKTGYAVASFQGKRWLVHRLLYMLFRGLIPPGLEPDHTCRLRPCVNPQHMDPVTHKINLLRGTGFAAQNAAKGSCKNGHPFTEASTYLPSRGGRECRPCRARTERARKRRLRAARY